MAAYDRFAKKFEEELVPEYIKFVQENYDNFLDYGDEVDKLERSSNEFINLSRYHLESIETNEKYYELYRQSIKERTGDDIGKFKKPQPD